MSRGLIAVLLLGACGTSQPAPEPETTGIAEPEGAPVLTSLSMLAGDWMGETRRMCFAHAAGALFGVSFEAADGPRTTSWTVSVVSADELGHLRLQQVIDNQAAPVLQVTADGQSLRLAQGDDVTRAATLLREGDNLVERIFRGLDLTTTRFQPHREAPAHVLEEADRAFSAAVAKGGVDAWVAAFEPQGVMGWKAAVRGHEAIRAQMDKVFGDGSTVRWAPFKSALAPGGELGFTFGLARWSKDGKDSARGAYVTLWRKQADGGWKVLFDAGVIQ